MIQVVNETIDSAAAAHRTVAINVVPTDEKAQPIANRNVGLP